MRYILSLALPVFVLLPCVLCVDGDTKQQLSAVQEIVRIDNPDSPLDVRKYFHEVQEDMTRVTWVHRCNTRAQLEAALSSNVMMIEADIIAGHLAGAGGGPPIPVMGHPPDTMGDLSLEQFLDMVLRRRSGKGIKLDFKSLAIFRASENVLEQFLARAEVDFPVWINADIVRGPGHSLAKDVVDPHYFLRTCVNKFPHATISAGWTVDTSKAEKLKYNSSHIDAMTNLLIESNVVHPVTFPVHAGIASNSLDTLGPLVHFSMDGTSLTLWAQKGDWVHYQKLRELVEIIGKDKVFVDMPQEMKEKLMTASLESSSVRHVSGGLALLLATLLVMY